jgi:tRNA(Arg) A34 adenosine deaminase TadA
VSAAAGERHLQEAIALARDGMRRGSGGPFGAVVVRDGAVVGRGWNRVLETNDPTAHAEVVAIRDATARLGRFALHDCEIYASCEPCPMCLGAIHWARLPRLVYAATREEAAAAGFSDADFYRELALPAEQRLLRAERLDLPESRSLFEEWARLEGRKLY